MDTQKIGIFIKERRTAVGLTQKELAERLGCTDKAVSRWETGRGMPDISFVVPLSRVLCVSVGELIAGEKYLEKASSSSFEKGDEHLTGTENNAVFSEMQTDEEKTLSTEEKKYSGTFSEQIDDIIKKNDETLVEVIADNEKKLRRLDRSSFFTVVMCCLQVTVFFAMPQLLPDNAPSIGLMITFTVLNSALTGLFGNRTKWIFPLFVFLLLFFANALNGTSGEGWILTYIGFLFAICSLGVVAVFSLFKFLFSLSKAKRKQP